MDDRFVNPYTFVPLPKGGAVRSDCTAVTEPVFSGEIKCRLITKTQIAVPDILKNPFPRKEDRTEPKEYDFFTLDGKAAIPGSGIRGVIRSVYEVLTDSCMHLNDKDDDYFHTRVNKEKPGIIKYDRLKDEYTLYNSKRVRDKTGSDYKTGDLVNYDTKPGKGKAAELVESFSDGGKDTGVYLRVDTFGTGKKKSNPSVFRYIETETGTKIGKVYIDCLEANIKMYKGKYKKDYENAIKVMKKGDGMLPVWYWQDRATGHYYLAPSQYSRAVFVKKPRDIVENAGMQACTSPKCCCAACAMFGFIADGKGDSQSRASHVRFTDAICEQSDCFDGSYLLPVLSGPRLSSFEFYLSGNEKNSLGPDSSNVTIAGRKFYWHAPQNVIKRDDYFAGKRPKLATYMQLVKKGTEFTFRVFFDKITDEQLKKLVFALNLGENFAGSARCHKVGHGKPVGLGSVKITVDRIIKRSFEHGIYSVNDVTSDIVSKSDIDLFQKTPELEAFLDKVLDMNYTHGKTVDYPREIDNYNIFKWFAGNREDLRSEGYIQAHYHLPRITDDDQTLTRFPGKVEK